jgi:hypothetical protein
MTTENTTKTKKTTMTKTTTKTKTWLGRKSATRAARRAHRRAVDAQLRVLQPQRASCTRCSSPVGPCARHTINLCRSFGEAEMAAERSLLSQGRADVDPGELVKETV